MDSNLNKPLIGKVLEHIQSTASTNDLLKEKLKDRSIENGYSIFTSDQFQGRGQRGNSWENSSGDILAFSSLVFPKGLFANEANKLSAAIALGTQDFLLSELEIESKVKWPNDLFAGNKKIAGILIENQIQGKEIESSVIGVGINLNQEYFPPELPNATSANMLLGRVFDPMRLAPRLAFHLDNWYKRLERGGWRQIREIYEQEMYSINAKRRFQIDGNAFLAIVKGIDANGNLHLESEGRNTFHPHGSIKWLIEED